MSILRFMNTDFVFLNQLGLNWLTKRPKVFAETFLRPERCD